MSYDYNKVLLIGNLGNDPLYFNQGERPFAAVSLATNKSYKKGEKTIHQVQWHSLAFFGQWAELAQQSLHKGDKIFVEGELVYQTSSYDKADQPIAQIVVKTFRLLNVRADNRNDSTPSSDSEPSNCQSDTLPF